MSNLNPTTCDSRIATVCEHNPKSAQFTLSNGRQVIERKMCNGATDVSMFDDVEMTEFEWQEYCQTVIPARWRLEASAKNAACGVTTLGPDDLIIPCVLPTGHGGYCSTGR